MFVCLFSVEIQTARPISVKFDFGIFFDGGKVLSWVLTPYPNPRGPGALYRVPGGFAASTVRLGENIRKQNLKGAPVLVVADCVVRPVIWVLKDLGPICYWSHGQSFSGRFYNTKVAVHVPSVL